MKKPIPPLLFWTPRVLVILFSIFVSIFALDVFGMGYTFWQTVQALLIHLIPTYLVLLALAVAWRWEHLGGVLFIGLGLLYVYLFQGRFPWSTYLIISGPLFLVGVLFLANGWIKAKRKAGA